MFRPILLAWFAIVLIVLILSGLGIWRWNDRRMEASVWWSLLDRTEVSKRTFNPSMIENLPEPAQRYFLYTITPGASLKTAVEITMEGELGFGDKHDPNYNTMRAHQILAPPHGFVWQVTAGPISGSDGATTEASWTRFWLFGLIPIVRAGGDVNHHRSAFGRVVSEGAFWVPASLLPSKTVHWEPIDDATARAVVNYGAFEQAVDITVTDNGQPVRVVIQRWSNENAEKIFKAQPFGGYLSEFKTFEGYRLPTRVEGGNLIGTDDYFPFYKAEVTKIRFP